MENEKTDEEKLDLLRVEAEEKLARLSKNEDFIFWKEQVVEPTIAQLEIELSSSAADLLPEAILRGKLKQLNSLKFMFRDVFINN